MRIRLSSSRFSITLASAARMYSSHFALSLSIASMPSTLYWGVGTIIQSGPLMCWLGPVLGLVAEPLAGEEVAHVEASALQAQVVDALEEAAVEISGPDHLQEGRLDVAGADHRLPRPDLLRAPGGVVAQAHAERAAVLDDDLLHRAAGAEDRPVRHRAAEEGVEVSVHVST